MPVWRPLLSIAIGFALFEDQYKFEQKEQRKCLPMPFMMVPFPYITGTYFRYPGVASLARHGAVSSPTHRNTNSWISSRNLSSFSSDWQPSHLKLHSSKSLFLLLLFTFSPVNLVPRWPQAERVWTSSRICKLGLNVSRPLYSRIEQTTLFIEDNTEQYYTDKIVVLLIQ